MNTLRPVALELVSGAAHYTQVVERVLEARVSVWIATANLKDIQLADPARRGRARFRSMLEALVPLAERGVELRILHARMPSKSFQQTFDALPALVGGGLELRQCPRVHLKTVIVDGTWLYLGSANWTGAGLGVRNEDARNFELGIVTDDEALLDDTQALYDGIWRGAHCARCRLREVCEAPLDR